MTAERNRMIKGLPDAARKMLMAGDSVKILTIEIEKRKASLNGLRSSLVTEHHAGKNCTFAEPKKTKKSASKKHVSYEKKSTMKAFRKSNLCGQYLI